ncbi:MAG: Rieske 2Fe-2S domain-containing protein [Chitinophagaceae bacterium]|jgi:3-phenylpropionate/trans-cinnamate dioxygenase ferredoxin subunit|nr:Rieske 2Fe-2S domain-containing protein [Chitinophagaceae bacterium]
MFNKTTRWQKIAEHINELIPEDVALGILEVDGKKMTIGRRGDIMFVCAHKCPHAGGILSQGFIDALGNLVCPLHRFKFNPCNGFNVSGEGYYLRHWPIECREDGVWIGMEEK